MSRNGRLLHFVYKIADRKDSVAFYRKLGMKVLRHEEFVEGCEAQCNGPYDGKWSKSMIGFGDEDTHFVAELTYNYGLREYERGNSHCATLINSADAFAKFNGKEGESFVDVTSPSGYNFRILNRNSVPGGGVILSSTDLDKTSNFWKNVAQMDHAGNGFFYGDRPDIRLEFRKTDKIIMGKNYGRTAIAWPTNDLANIEKRGVEFGGSVLTPLLTLPTPGKADVVVVILADPDGHEVCFVGDEAFRELSATDPAAEALINQAIESDKSNEWIQKQKLKEERMKKL